MNNVIAFQPAPRISSYQDRYRALIACFAADRRDREDVYWMKENAELLNILLATGSDVPLDALAPFEEFYSAAERRLTFFPQYYRFLLSMVMDLEDLGMAGSVGQQLAERARDMDLVGAELSDLQRAEARRLMNRRGVDPLGTQGLDDRLRAFTNRCATFALPNKKASYELTHIAFYLSDYGKINPQFTAEAIQSLHFAGLMAFIEQNADLLAEICVALRYCGEIPPRAWTDWLDMQSDSFTFTSGPSLSCADDYHSYFMCNWHAGLAGQRAFGDSYVQGRMRFDRTRPSYAPLREMSYLMMQMDQARSSDWSVMRPRLASTLTSGSMDIIDCAAGSTGHFEAFFEGFARAGQA